MLLARLAGGGCGVASRLLRGLCVLGIAWLLAGATLPDLQREHAFDIPRQDAESALNALADQSGFSLLFLHDQVRSMTANPVKGVYTVEEALDILLIHTGLAGSLTKDGVITISKSANTNEKVTMVNNKKSFLATAISLLLGSGAVQHAFAQANPDVQDTGARAIEEVIVTAEHRLSTVQDTELSITAFSEAMVRDLGISNASDIGEYTPNLTISPLIGGRSGFSVNIRGVRNGESQMSFDPSVGVYLDGVLIAKNGGSLLDAVDIERVEVLRGPQGTLYGRNTVGGTINIITKKPTDRLEGRLEATLGSYNERNLRGVLNVPILDSSSPLGMLSLRATGALLNRDGLYDNDYVNAPQSEVQTEDRDVATAHLLWQPADALEVMYSYDRTDTNEVPMPTFPTNADTSKTAGNAIAPYLEKQDDRPSSGNWDTEYYAKTDVEGHALNISYDITDSLSLVSITAQRDTVNKGQGDADGSPANIFYTVDTADVDVFTQEFRVVGDAFDYNLNYVIGAYYLDEDGEQSSANVIFTRPSIDNATFQVKAKAIYMQGTYALNDQWNLTAGVRYTEEERAMQKVRISSGIATEYPDAEKDFDNVSPMLSIGYHWNDEVMTYAKVSQGYQSGGFNSRDQNPVDFTTGFEEETLTAYELGWKSTFLDGRYRLNGAIFYSDYTDKQVNNLSTNSTNPTNVIRNAGTVEISGIELEFIAALSRSVEVGVDYGYTNAEYAEYLDTNGNDLSNYTFPYTPENSFHAFASYYFPRMNIGQLSARLDWSYQDEITFLSPTPELNSGDAYALWNARVTLSEIAGPGDTSMRVSLWGKNLTDESYWNFGVNLYSGLGYNINGYGDPRTVGVDLAIEF